jgi:hypothetical protein
VSNGRFRNDQTRVFRSRTAPKPRTQYGRIALKDTERKPSDEVGDSILIAWGGLGSSAPHLYFHRRSFRAHITFCNLHATCQTGSTDLLVTPPFSRTVVIEPCPDSGTARSRATPVADKPRRVAATLGLLVSQLANHLPAISLREDSADSMKELQMARQPRGDTHGS